MKIHLKNFTLMNFINKVDQYEEYYYVLSILNNSSIINFFPEAGRNIISNNLKFKHNSYIITTSNIRTQNNIIIMGFVFFKIKFEKLLIINFFLINNHFINDFLLEMLYYINNNLTYIYVILFNPINYNIKHIYLDYFNKYITYNQNKFYIINKYHR